MEEEATFGTRLREVREHFGLSGQQFGKKLGLSKQQVSLLENNDRDLTAEHVKNIYLSFQIDPRFFFNMLETPKDAVLTDAADAPTTENVMKRLISIEEKIRPAEGDDPVAHRVAVNAPLRSMVQKLMFLDGSLIETIDAYVQGFLTARSLRNDAEREPPKAAGQQSAQHNSRPKRAGKQVGREERQGQNRAV